MAKKTDDDKIKDIEDYEITKNKDDIPEWERGFNQDNLDKVAELGILPELKPRKNANYEAIIIRNPIEKDTNVGKLWIIEITHEGIHKSMICNQSFLFSYGAMRRANKFTSKQLIGKTIKFQKKESGMISVQLPTD